MVRIVSLACMCIVFFSTCLAQTTEGAFFLYKNDGSAAKDLRQSDYFLHVILLNDTALVGRYYHTNGPMIRQESFKDSNLTIPHGRFCWYNSKGALDSTGYVTNGKKDGGWEYHISNTQTDFITYDHGALIKIETRLYDKHGKEIAGRDKKEDTAVHTLVKAIYKTGINDWIAYCQNNLKTPQRLQNVLSLGTHTATVCFLINKEGNTDDIFLTQSCEWSGDAEVLRLIAESPKWQPASKDGKPVIYRQRQSLSYSVRP